MNNSYITIIKEKRTDLSRKRIPLNQNKCTADFRMSVPFEQNLHFYTGDKSRHNGSTGLGLAVVKTLVAILGGNIVAKVHANSLIITLEL